MTQQAFRNGVRSAVRGLWNGSLSRSQFTSSLQSTIARNLQVAWNEGAAECAVQADELTDDEIKARDAFIKEQQGYVSGFGGDIREVDKLSKGKLQPLFERAEMWVNRWNDAKNQARSLACGNKKLTWLIGPTEQHCRDCSKYNGRTYRASNWGDIRPQHPNLACHGYRCKCQFQVTDKRASRGKPEAMTG